MVDTTPTWWFGSDFHFGHQRMLQDGYRPFASVQEMDERLIETWNQYVKPWDIVMVLGDFSFYKPDITSKILGRLNGQKTLIKGNHDSSKDNVRVVGWNRVLHYHEQRLMNRTFVLSHFPFLTWNRMHYGAYHLHGHSHGSLHYPPPLDRARILDVGIDHIVKLKGQYRPLAVEEVIDLLSLRGPTSTDHHRISYADPLEMS